MCRWMGSHFHNWINYCACGVALLKELLEWGCTFSGFWESENSGMWGFKSRKIYKFNKLVSLFQDDQVKRLYNVDV